MIILIISDSVFWVEQMQAQSLLILSEYQRFCTKPTSLIVDIYRHFSQKSRNVYRLLLHTISQAIPGPNSTLVFAFKMNAKRKLSHAAMLLFCISQKDYINKRCMLLRSIAVLGITGFMDFVHCPVF
jgi:hypothetical protein